MKCWLRSESCIAAMPGKCTMTCVVCSVAMVDLSDERGNLKFLVDHPLNYASDILKERESFVLIRIESKWKSFKPLSMIYVVSFKEYSTARQLFVLWLMREQEPFSSRMLANERENKWVDLLLSCMISDQVKSTKNLFLPIDSLDTRATEGQHWKQLAQRINFYLCVF
jgi:hypothetical protein